tara:strand:+ start:1495 stop:2214 length:720 start_codon:yes stop_codon:yes gene_type:complete
MFKYLNNKKVIVIGPSKSLLDRKDGSFIDSFDVVVRINRGIEPTDTFSKEIGSRCDILYNCMLEHPDNGGVIDVPYLVKHNLKYVVYHPEVSFGGKAINKPPKHLNHEKIKQLHLNGIKTEMIDCNFYNTISSQTNCRPNTGFIALFDLLRYNISELYITGFTFYLDTFMSGYKDHVDKVKFNNKCFTSQRHNQQNLWKFLKDQAHLDSRIKTDLILQRILSLDELKNDQETINYVFQN